MLLKRNLIANYLGQIWSAFIGIAFVPYYIKILGVESYGMVGFFSILLAWFSLLEMGLTPTINREMARYNAGIVSEKAIQDLVRTIECILVFLAILIVCAIFFLSPVLSSSWIKSSHLPLETISRSIEIMGFVVATRIWEEIYRSAIRGMQEQLWLNLAQAFLVFFRWGGALAVIYFIEPTIETFFYWQFIASVLSLLVYAKKTHQLLPRCSIKAKFDLKALNEVRNFAGGVAAITLLALLLTQIDKFLLSGILSLEQFGYYTLAGVAAGGITQLIIPMNSAVYPRFTELLASERIANLIDTYHSCSQLMAIILVPPGLLLAMFSKEILIVWTGSQTIAEHTGPILSLVAIGTLLNGLMNIPYMLLLANGNTSFSVKVNILSALFLVPSILIFVPIYGAIGAAWIWIILNAFNLFVSTNFMYQFLLSSERVRWYKYSIFTPLIVGSVILFVYKLVSGVLDNLYNMFISFFVVYILMLVMMVLISPNIRVHLWEYIAKMRINL